MMCQTAESTEMPAPLLVSSQILYLGRVKLLFLSLWWRICFMDGAAAVLHFFFLFKK